MRVGLLLASGPDPMRRSTSVGYIASVHPQQRNMRPKQDTTHNINQHGWLLAIECQFARCWGWLPCHAGYECAAERIPLATIDKL